MIMVILLFTVTALTFGYAIEQNLTAEFIEFAGKLPVCAVSHSLALVSCENTNFHIIANMYHS